MSEKHTERLIQNSECYPNENSDNFEDDMKIKTYSKMYSAAFSAITDAMLKLMEVSETLCRTQQYCEKIFMETNAAAPSPGKKAAAPPHLSLVK